MRICAAGGFKDALSLTPKTAESQPGTTHTVVAHLEKASGMPGVNQVVLFEVAGANPTTGRSASNGEGDAQFSYVGPNAGTDGIGACWDQDRSGSCGKLEPSATAAKFWIKPNHPPTVACDGGYGSFEFTSVEGCFVRRARYEGVVVYISRSDPDGDPLQPTAWSWSGLNCRPLSDVHIECAVINEPDGGGYVTAVVRDSKGSGE